nr:MAG TPA: hypothetical protein [Bacteriophage sp.]
MCSNLGWVCSPARERRLLACPARHGDRAIVRCMDFARGLIAYQTSQTGNQMTPDKADRNRG